MPEVLIIVLAEDIFKLPSVTAARRSNTADPVIVKFDAFDPKADTPLTIRVPPLMVVPPVYELLPDRVCEPACKTMLPPVPPIDPLKLSLLAAVSANDCAPRLTEPAPAKLLILAPELVPLISKVPVAVRTEESAMDPLPERLKVPVLIMVAPVKVLALDRVKVPVPSLVKATVDVEPSWITPEKFVLVSLPPAVNTGVPLTVLVTRPVLAPAKEPTAVEYPAKSKVPLSTKAELLDVALVAPNCKVEPLLIVVVPA